MSCVVLAEKFNLVTHLGQNKLKQLKGDLFHENGTFVVLRRVCVSFLGWVREAHFSWNVSKNKTKPLRGLLSTQVQRNKNRYPPDA